MERDAQKNLRHCAHASLRAMALVEVGKGVLALLAAGCIATFGATRIDKAIDRLASMSHVDTIHRALSAVASDINPASVQLVAAVIAAYGALRLTEGWGLWRARSWASSGHRFGRALPSLRCIRIDPLPRLDRVRRACHQSSDIVGLDARPLRLAQNSASRLPFETPAANADV